MIEFDRKQNTRSLLNDINQQLEEVYFMPLDIKVAELGIESLKKKFEPDEQNWLSLLLAHCHHQTRSGHLYICAWEPPEELLLILPEWPDSAYLSLLLSGFEETGLPFYFSEKQYLYLRKYHDQETLIVDHLCKYVNAEPHESNEEIAFLNELASGCSKEQVEAIQATMKNRFILLSGGPGTGKTFTVLRCIAQILSEQKDAKIVLCAPTGKAVARLVNSIQQGLDSLPVTSDVKKIIPTSAMTLHRFLNELKKAPEQGFLPSVPSRIDWLFVDEASMVDLKLMAAILKSIPVNCRLFLIGDVNQLASVQPGAVLSDIFNALKGISDDAAIKSIELKKTFRFSTSSVLYELCESIKNGRTKETLEILNRADQSVIHWVSPEDAQVNECINRWIEEYMIKHALAESAIDALKGFRNSILLSATNKGPWGVNALNYKINQQIQKRLSTGTEVGSLQYWKPILILENDYRNGLFNGDIGIQQVDTRFDNDSGLCYFLREETELTRFASQSLPNHSDAFAVTIHKSQGSESERVAIILPTSESPMLTRELIYTAISRAKSELFIVGESSAISVAILNKTVRKTRLGQILRTKISLQ